MKQDHIFAITFQSDIKKNAKRVYATQAEYEAFELEYEKFNAQILYLNFAMSLKAAVSGCGKQMSTIAKALDLDVNHLSKVYVIKMLLIISLDGTAIPTESDIQKLVSFFQLNQNQHVILNNAALASNLVNYDIIGPFYGTDINT